MTTAYTAGAARAAMAAFPIMPLESLGLRRLVVVAPHPDDESLGCGGLIAACRHRDLAVSIVVVSDGAGSHPNSASWPPARLARLRHDETLAAAGALGVPDADVHFLGLPDRSVPIEGTEAARASTELAALAVGADVLAVTWRHDPHADHQASHALARTAVARVPGVRVWEYPIWGLTLPDDTALGGPFPQGFRFDIEAFRREKSRAIAAHVSQTTGLIDDDPKGFRLERDMIARFTGRYETFIEVGA